MAVTGIKRLSSTGAGRLSTTAARAASKIPVQPTTRKAGREKIKNATDPSAVLCLLKGSGCLPRMPKIVAAASPAAKVTIPAAISLALFRDKAKSSDPTTYQKAP